MLFYGIRWPGVLTGMIVYCAMFALARQEATDESGGASAYQAGLLLFMLPGILMALINRQAPLSQALMVALVATPCCVMLTFSSLFETHAVLQELAWLASAIFWCGFGALLVMLWRMLCAGRAAR